MIITQLDVYYIIHISRNVKLISIDLSKQKKLDADPKTKQQINFIGNLDREEGEMFFIIEEGKETILDFSKGTVKVLWFYFIFI